MNKSIKIGKFETTPKKLLFLCLHLLIIIAFTVQIIYCIVAFGSVAASGSGTAGVEAGGIPFDEMVTRRLYAIELWISATGLAAYLGIVYRRQLVNFFKKGESDDKETSLTDRTDTENRQSK